MSNLLEVEDLHVHFQSATGEVHAVRGVSFSLGVERIGIVGESGSGKSTVGRAILGLHPTSARVSAKKLCYRDQDLLTLSPAGLRKLRGSSIAMVLQDPRFSLNPVMRIGTQITEALKTRKELKRNQVKEKGYEILRSVWIRDPQRVWQAYPHQLSGGLGQRVMIAMMLAASPDILIADEPTSALDVMVQLQVLAIMDDLVRERGMGLIIISHDLNLVSSFCDRVLIMYAGRVVESLDAKNLHLAQHPYTRGLLACLPTLDKIGRDLPVLKRDEQWAELP